MSDIQQPGWWQASDGKWYPPQDGQPSSAPGTAQTGTGPGGLVAFLGWGMVLAGFAVVISLLVDLQDRGEFGELNFGDYVTGMWPGFMVIAAGATAAGVGHLVSHVIRRDA